MGEIITITDAKTRHGQQQQQQQQVRTLHILLEMEVWDLLLTVLHYNK